MFNPSCINCETFLSYRRKKGKTIGYFCPKCSWVPSEEDLKEARLTYYESIEY